MLGYVSPNVPVVPRILPNQHPSKRFAMPEEGYHSPSSTHITPPLMPHQAPLSTRTQLQQNEHLRMKRGLYHEPLKDNSGDYQYPHGEYQYPMNDHDRLGLGCSGENSSKYWTGIVIIYGIVIGLFSLTALTISIYLLIRFSKYTTTTAV